MAARAQPDKLPASSIRTELVGVSILDLDDIQHFLLQRPRAIAARYGFLTFREPAQARAYLAGLVHNVGTAATAAKSTELDARWVTVAFTWNGLRALGVPEMSLATFPAEFREGMAARAAILGDTGVNHPRNWTGQLASPELHAVIILFARDIAERQRCVREHQEYAVRFPSVQVCSYLDLEAIPPYDCPREHFGYRDRITEVVVKGTGQVASPGSGEPLEPGEFVLGYADEDSSSPPIPEPEILARNGSFLAYRQLHEHVGRFREFLRQNAETPEEQEYLAAKLMGRWRSGAPLVLAPAKDDPELAQDMQRNNDFNYKQMDPVGYAAPRGCHIRRMNPRDTAVNVNRRRLIRRGGTYGPLLPEGCPEDGAERGIAAFLGCASLIRQFEFAQNVWINDPDFQELGTERDPIIGDQDGTLDFTIPKRPIRRKITGLPSFTTVRGGAYFFLPGLRALRWLTTPGARGS
jgi:deferrochelatase/peroxidase EfeB